MTIANGLLTCLETNCASVFLRLLEYYQGILFLTTNRLGDFDEAFANRIHVSIEYGTLGPEARMNIWRQHIRKACQQNRSKNLWSDEAYRILGKIEINGRDIRNIARTGFGLAHALDRDLDISHIVSVIRINPPNSRNQDIRGILAELEELHRRVISSVGEESQP